MKCSTCFAVTDDTKSCEALTELTNKYRKKCPWHKTPEQLKLTEDKAKARLLGKGIEEFKTCAEVTTFMKKREERSARYTANKKARKTAENSPNKPVDES